MLLFTESKKEVTSIYYINDDFTNMYVFLNKWPVQQYIIQQNIFFCCFSPSLDVLWIKKPNVHFFFSWRKKNSDICVFFSEKKIQIWRGEKNQHWNLIHWKCTRIFFISYQMYDDNKVYNKQHFRPQNLDRVAQAHALKNR